MPRRYDQLELLPDAPPYGAELMRRIGLRGLQCGSGPKLPPGWMNTDMVHITSKAGEETERGRIAVLDGNFYFMEHDATEPFPFEDASFDWVYSEHFIEHLEPAEAIAWLTEMHRILRPGGHIRVSTPDMGKYMRGYADPAGQFFDQHHERVAPHLKPFAPDDESVPLPRRQFAQRYMPGEQEVPARRAFLVNQIFFFWGHKWIYDFEELRWALSCAGFDPANVVERGFREGSAPELAQLDLELRNDESVYAEAVRT